VSKRKLKLQRPGCSDFRYLRPSLAKYTFGGSRISHNRHGYPFLLWRPQSSVGARRLRAPIKFRRIRPLKDSFRSLTSIDSPLYGVTNSDLSSYSKVFRLKNYLNGRANSLVSYYQRTYKGLEEFDASLYVKMLAEVAKIRSWSDRLDSNSIVLHAPGVYESVFEFSKSFPRKFDDHCLALFGSFKKTKARNINPDSEESRYMEYLENNSRHGRRTEIISRALHEAELRKDWFFLFNTLTVRPGAEDLVFGAGAKAWSEYVVGLDRYFGRAAYGSVRKAIEARAKGQEYHLYMAVVEHGSVTGRLHIHVVHIFKKLPKDFSDPNLGKAIPFHREINFMRKFWKYGDVVSPIAVRFNPNDAYGKMGWKWPLKKDKKTPLQIRDSHAIIRYLAKYLNKSYNIRQAPEIYYRTLPERKSECPTIQKKRIWRARISRNMGRQPLLPIINKITSMQARRVLVIKKLPKIPGIRLPRMMMRRLIMRRYLPRLIRLASVQVMKYHAILASPKKPVERLRDSIAKLRQFSPANSGSIRIRDSLGMVAYKKLEDMIRERFTSTNINVRGLAGPNFKIC